MLTYTEKSTYIPPQWKKISNIEKIIWDYFDTRIVPEIIADGLNQQFSLVVFLQHLDMARKRCECIKGLCKATQQLMTIGDMDYFYSNLFVSYPEGFGHFQYGASIETDVFHEDYGLSAQLMEKRILDKTNGSLALSRKHVNTIGLHLYHPEGYVLNKLEGNFIKLCKTTNIFDFFKLASQLMYWLSNYPTVTRGSSSIHTWLIEGIGKKNFGFTTILKPDLHDWAAYCETNMQYLSYFVISAVIKYMQSLKGLPSIDEIAAEATRVLQENPNFIDNLHERKNLWQKLQSLANSFATSTIELTATERKALREIAEATLDFPLPSLMSQEIVEFIIKNGDDIYTPEKIIALLPASHQDYFSRVYLFKQDLQRTALMILGHSKKEAKIAQSLFIDGEYIFNLRCIDQSSLGPVSSLSRELSIILDDPIACPGWINPEKYNDYKELLTLARNIEKQCVFALNNTACLLSDLNAIFMESKYFTEIHLKLLTCRAAVMLYNNHKLKIKVFDLFDSNPEEIERNILNLILENYNHDLRKEITDTDLKNFLLTYLDPAIFRNGSALKLANRSLGDIQKDFFQSYLESVFFFDGVNYLHVLDQEEVSSWLEKFVQSDFREVSQIYSEFITLVFEKAEIYADIETYKGLIACKYPIHITYYYSLFHSACKNNNLQLANLIYDSKRFETCKKKVINYQRDWKRQHTALHVACYQNNIDVVGFLLKKEGIDTNIKNGFYITPLGIAVENRNLEIIKMLLNHPDTNPNYVVTYINLEEDLEILNLLLNNKNTDVNNINCYYDLSILLTAIECNYVETARLLIMHPNIRLEQTTKSGCTPLYISCQYGRESLVSSLLARKARVDAIGISGHTPLQVACLSGQTQVIRSLLEYGASLTHTNHAGQTALDIAVIKEHKETIHEILRYAREKNILLSSIISMEQSGKTIFLEIVQSVRFPQTNSLRKNTIFHTDAEESELDFVIVDYEFPTKELRCVKNNLPQTCITLEDMKTVIRCVKNNIQNYINSKMIAHQHDKGLHRANALLATLENPDIYFVALVIHAFISDKTNQPFVNKGTNMLQGIKVATQGKYYQEGIYQLAQIYAGTNRIKLIPCQQHIVKLLDSNPLLYVNGLTKNHIAPDNPDNNEKCVMQ